MNRIRIRIKELYAIIEKSEKEISELRDKCLHKKCFIDYYSFRIGQTFIYNICETCGKAVSPATKKDMEKFYNEGGVKLGVVTHVKK